MPIKYTTEEGGEWEPYVGDAFDYSYLLEIPPFFLSTEEYEETFSLLGLHALYFASGHYWDILNGWRSQPPSPENSK